RSDRDWSSDVCSSDLGPAPHELLPAALAACVSTTLVMYARTKGWELGEVMVDVEYDNRSTPRRFEIAIRLRGDLADAQLERLDRSEERRVGKESSSRW